jgi:proton-translocating NADH-quinone oxidoreductase chain N
MFTWLVDGLLLFTVTTPVIGRLARYTRWKPLVELYALAGFVVAIYFLATLSLRVQAEGVVVLAVGPPGTPVGVHLVVDPLSVFMSGIFVAVGFIAILFSGRYMQRDTGRPVYYALILGITTGMVGVVEAGDLFTLFVFWEVMALCSYALVAFRKASWEPVEAGYKYLIMSAAGGVTALFAMSLLYGMTGTLNLAALARALGNASGGQWMYLSLTMIIAGFGLQAGMAPLHAWLPDAHSAAPAPVSAILSGAMVMTGVYGLLRLLPLVFLPLQGAWTLTLAVFAVASMFTGNLMALLQDDVKRLLAYSTIANVGYILLGLASQTIAGVTGSLFQMLNHAVVKALLFLCSGAYLHQVKTRNLRDLGGIGRRMPLTSAVFVVGAVALAGIPPLNVFWSEWAILAASIKANLTVFTGLMLANLAITAAYSLRMVQAVLLKAETIGSDASEAPSSMLLPMVLLAVACLVIGVYPTLLHSVAEWAAHSVLEVQTYVEAVLGT